MEVEIILGVILASIGGLYWALFKMHGCVEGLKKDVNSLVDFEKIKEELIDLKDTVRQFHG